jgi:sucrose-6-phosphate hydrolase SacC (GH32 family)
VAEGLAFHAAPPSGEWLNDPNGLVFDGRWRLFAQHRADAPDFRATGWARLSSPDLLRWTFDGPAIAPEGDLWAYSGSIASDAERLLAWHTGHAGGFERQVRRESLDAGRSWSPPLDLPTLGPPARNRRDPFVFRDGGGWALLLAEPCDWHDWAAQPPSRLALYRSADGVDWQFAGHIGPWRPPGVMWEVPVLLRLGGHDMLIVSEIDRRSGGAECSVSAWLGALGEKGLERDDHASPEGWLPLDLGPDFYALCPALSNDPSPDHAIIVAWASSWAAARQPRWPGFHGGPISLPRALTLRRHAGLPRLANRPATGIVERFTQRAPVPPAAGLGVAALPASHGAARLTLANATSALEVEAAPRANLLSVRRDGPEALRWGANYPFDGDATDEPLLLFVDGPLVELFLPGVGPSITVALDGSGGPVGAAIFVDGHAVAIDWRTLA